MLSFLCLLNSYTRAQANDTTISEMDPSDTFTLNLRHYQKQALLWVSFCFVIVLAQQLRISWMYSRETGAASARKSHSIHPLWSE